MTSEAKNCQNCKTDFVIELEDFQFYEKIQVPPPTWCPECRAFRRHSFWGEKTLFRKKESREGKETFSSYSEKSPIKIYERDYWWGDGWDPMTYGREYDFSKNFFKQFRELMLAVPWPSRSVQQMVNSDYCDQAGYFKNCYLCFNGEGHVDCLYGVAAVNMKNSIDFYQTENSELCYEAFNLTDCYQTFFSEDSNDCRNSWFLKGCIDCSDCFGCVDLRHKQYHIFNQPYSKEEYIKKLKEFNLGSYQSIQKLKGEFTKFSLNFPRKYGHLWWNSNVVGEYVYRSKNSRYCYQAVNLENVHYSQNLSRGTKDTWDYTNWGNNSELIYECSSSGENIKNLKFCYDCWPGCNDLEYSMCCHSSSNLFGCVGLKKKQYCILNKQYPKEEYEKLVSQIKKQMGVSPHTDKKGKIYAYGEFFPIDFSPLAYNESSANDYFPKTREEVLNLGLEWRKPDQKEYQTTLKNEDIPDHIQDTGDSITKENLECGNCERAYKILERELTFYKRFELPVPRFCFNCRHTERVKLRNPMKWYRRKCMCDNQVFKNTIAHPDHAENPCPNEFETSYAPDRPEIVYCETCYNTEVN